MDETVIKKYVENDFTKALTYYDDRAKKSKHGSRILSVYLILVSAGLTLIVTLGPKTDLWRCLGVYRAG